jgi:hypothetical protein
MTHADPEAPRVATIHDVTKKTGRVLPSPSSIFHMYASVDTLWVAQTLPHCTLVKRGKVSSNSLTHEATQFGDSICPICVSTFHMLVYSEPTDADLNRHRRGLPPWSSEFMIQTTLNLPVLYSPLSRKYPTRSPIMPTWIIILLNHIGPPSLEKGPITSGFRSLVFYR